jgi:hypothetical protein
MCCTTGFLWRDGNIFTPSLSSARIRLIPRFGDKLIYGILKQLRWRQLAHVPDMSALFSRFSSKDEEKRMSIQEWKRLNSCS